MPVLVGVGNMKTAIVAFAISLFVTAILGMPLIRFLKKLKFGQKILEDGPKWHMSKQHTPTMGGVMFILGLLAALTVCFMQILQANDARPMLVFALSAMFGLIGFIDDFTKIRKKRNQGLTAMQKLLLQIAAAALFMTVLRYMGYISGDVFVPFINRIYSVSWWIYLPSAIFIIVGAVNAVNLTDGIDGLAASVTAVVCTFFTALFLMMQGGQMQVFAAGLLGALLGFLLFNKFPAKVFMGDTGALFLGGAVCGMAFASDMPLLLVPIGIIYIIETLSDIIQVVYFKISGGKRVFKMAPLHHHFEMCGWSEKKIVAIATIITIITCAISFYTLFF